MRLVHMDVDRNGADQRYRFGPLSPGLNAIVGGKGAGKSTLLGWLRTIAEENLGRTYVQPDPAWHTPHRIAGVVELQNRGAQYRITTDRNGRIRFDAINEVNTAMDRRWDGRLDPQIPATNLTNPQREAFTGLAAASGPYDTEAALEQLAQRLGLDQITSASNTDREQLLARQRELEARLQHLNALNASRETLIARQAQLETELQTARSSGEVLSYEGQNVEHLRLDQRLSALEHDLQDSLRQVESLDREIASTQTELNLLEVDPTTLKVGESYRAQLQKLDDRLDRWRQTLRDLKSHRETIEHNATDARLDKQIGEQLSSTKDADPRAAMRSLEAQITSTRRQLDMLVDRYTTVPGYDYRSASAAVAGTGFRPNEVPHSHGVYRDTNGQTFVGHPTYLPESSELPETLRSMQKDLHEVCQQLARHEAQTATETLRQQSAQLKRCEEELLQSVEKLIDERAALLRRIASEHHISLEQLTLAFGNWCQCHDHPHLSDWLLSEEGNCSTTSSHSDSAARQRLLEELEQLKARRRDASVRADECKRQIRDADVHRRGTIARKVSYTGRPEVEIQRDIQQVASDLASIAERERLQSELNEVLRSLNLVPHQPVTASRFRERTNHHIAGLMGSAAWTSVPTASSVTGHNGVHRTYDLVDGMVSEVIAEPHSTRRAVPAQISRLAMRLAIVEGMTERGEPIALIVDDALEAVSSDIQENAVAYLNSIAKATQQIILLTADQRVGELVRQYGGWSSQMHPTVVTEADPNRQLMALANDHEADKWYQPVEPERYGRRIRNEYYLSESSLIEDLPAIDPDLAARCRVNGVDRIGDLLDVDPLWLADQIRVAGVTRATVESWQAIADLLCNVPNLRPFDARVIVGAGIRTPNDLARIHPSELLDRVERFLTTDQGRKILRSGNSYELSRITTWIASAKGGSTRVASDMDEYDYRRRESNGRTTYRSDRNGEYNRSRSWESNSRRSYPVISRSGTRTSRNWDGSNSSTGRRRQTRTTTRSDREYEAREYSRGNSASKRYEHSTRSNERSREQSNLSSSRATDGENRLKFYLELESPVVDAPSIGPRMADRLQEFGIHTVADLLKCDAETLAEQLEHRRVDEDTIVAWQRQARLVCQIPNLRGHDAQLLVACDLNTPEELLNTDASDVLSQVTEVAESKEGQRILRGSKAPDLEEVNDWIRWAENSRSLKAA